MKQALFEAVPAYLEQEGCEAALAHLAGDIGVDGLQIRLSSGGATLAPRVPGGPRVLASDPGLQFPCELPPSLAARFRPRAAGGIRPRHELGRLHALAASNRLSLHAALPYDIPFSDCTAVPLIVNVFGDRSPSLLCRTHPDARELFTATLQSALRQCPLASIELIGMEPPTSGRAFQIRSLPQPAENDLMAQLLGWCFCAACRAKGADAGLHVDQVTAQVTAAVAAMLRLDGSAPTSLDAFLASNESASAWHALQGESTRAFLESLKQQVAVPLVLRLNGDGDPLRLPWRAWEATGLGLAVTESAANGQETWRSAPATLRGRTTLRVPCSPPAVGDGPRLVSLVHEASGAGIERFVFGDYGTLPAACLDWVRQAIRYARRDSR